MGKRTKSIFGSARASFFREPRRRRDPAVRRSQKIRFRRRSARSALRHAARSAWAFVQVGGVLGLAAWGIYEGREMWTKSEWLRVQNIAYEGDIPESLSGFLGLKRGQNLDLLNLTRKEADALKKYPELKSISISRTLMRGILVEGEARAPVALSEQNGHRVGVDEYGVVFPFSAKRPAPDDLPVIVAPSVDDRVRAVNCLLEWKRAAPRFYSLVKNLETDRMHAFHVELSNGVEVYWGEMDLEHVNIRARHILKLMESFAPKKTPAHLRFVTDDRMVIDANWVRAAPAK
jgi:cell division septal protein FtsQ